MRKLTLEILAAVALTLAAILASAGGVLASDVIVKGAFARASATPNASSAVAYVTIVNQGSQDDRLVSVTTPAAEMADVHQTISTDGAVSMRDMAALDLPAGQTIAMNPGGIHIMLMGLKTPLKKGGVLALDLTFEKAGKMTVDVPVGGVAANQPGG